MKGRLSPIRIDFHEVTPEVDVDPSLLDEEPQGVRVLLHAEQDGQGSVVVDVGNLPGLNMAPIYNDSSISISLSTFLTM